MLGDSVCCKALFPSVCRGQRAGRAFPAPFLKQPWFFSFSELSILLEAQCSSHPLTHRFAFCVLGFWLSATVRSRLSPF